MARDHGTKINGRVIANNSKGEGKVYIGSVNFFVPGKVPGPRERDGEKAILLRETGELISMINCFSFTRGSFPLTSKTNQAELSF